MKKTLRILLFVFVPLLFLTSACTLQTKVHALTDSEAAACGDECITSFDQKMVLNKNGDLDVTETITAFTYTNEEIKHGIYRDLPGWRYEGNYTHSTPFTLLYTGLNGKPVAYHTESVDLGTRIYLGDANTLLEPGTYIYTIHYIYYKQMLFSGSKDELYMNTNGTAWTLPILNLTAEVTLPADVPAAQLEVNAYTGTTGAQGKDFIENSAAADGKSVISFATTKALAAGENLTYSLVFPKGVVTEPSTIAIIIQFIFDNLLLILTIPVLLWVPTAAFFAWLTAGKDKKPVIIPLFSPPQDTGPAIARYITTFNNDDKALTAAIIELAVQRRVRIKEGKRSNYSLELFDPAPAKTSSSPEAEQLFQSFFGDGSDSVTFSQTQHTKLAAAQSAFRKAVNAATKPFMVPVNKLWYLLIFWIYLIFVGVMVLDFTEKNSAASFMIVIAASWLGLSAPFILPAFWKAGRNLFNSFSFSNLFGVMGIGCSVLILVGGGLAFAVVSVVTARSFLPALLTLLATMIPLFILMILIKAMKKRNDAGVKLYADIMGFKMFLTTTERFRIKQLIPQLPKELGTAISNVDESVARMKLFELFLPYAVALDVEKQWSQQFSDDFSKVSAEGQGQNQAALWYIGSSNIYSGGFASAISSGISSSFASGATTSSGSGGMGGSGGGGGGGGGGGW